MSQFRFRVMYRVPQIGLPPDMWPSSVPQSFAKAKSALPEYVGGAVRGVDEPGGLLDPGAESEAAVLMTGLRNPSRLKKSGGSQTAGEVCRLSARQHRA